MTVEQLTAENAALAAKVEAAKGLAAFVIQEYRAHKVHCDQVGAQMPALIALLEGERP